MKKDTIDNIPLKDQERTTNPNTHAQFVHRQAYTSKAYERPIGDKICKLCYQEMTYMADGGGYVCMNKECKPKDGLRFDWTIPEGYVPRRLAVTTNMEEYKQGKR